MAKPKNLKVQLPYSTNSHISFCKVDIEYNHTQITKYRTWLKQACESEKRQLGELGYNFCSDNFLLDMNKQHLNHDYYTDIITFDFSEGKLVSGDIYISIERVKENAKTENTTFKTELKRVIIHGLLHLCGYKDKSPKEAKLMRQKEDYYLSLWP
jgi:probable rRNA maturation factor